MGKSRYASLVKLKKRDLDTAERDLIAANNRVAAASAQLDAAYETLRLLNLPQEGSVRELFQSNALIQMQHETIENAKAVLNNALSAQQHQRELYNRARADHEKFKYLEVEEQNAQIRKLKDQEAKILDEIGTMMHKREKK